MQEKQQTKQTTDGKNKPKHVGIIIDGNRRYARRLRLQLWKGHDYGYEKVKKLLDWCKELDIKELTLYVLSIENFQRPRKEVSYLMKILERALNDLLTDKRVDENQLRIEFIGRTEMLPRKIQLLMKKVRKKTENYEKYRVNLAIAYSGREEIVDAVKKIAEKIKKGKIKIKGINQKTIFNNLYLKSEPDLIIRTSGERRISGFLLYQGHYAELYFCKKFWPEFTKADLKKALKEFAKRKRRFGR